MAVGRQLTCALIWAWSVGNLILASFVFVIWQDLHSQTLKSSCSFDPSTQNIIKPGQAYGYTAFKWTNGLVWGYFFISIFVCATWTVLSIISFVHWKKNKILSDASTGKIAERMEMFFWTAILFVMTLLLAIMCWTVSYNRSVNGFLFCDLKSGCCAENCYSNPQSNLYLASCNPAPVGAICPGSAGASPVALGCTAYNELLLPLSSIWNYTGSVGAGSVRSFHDFSAGYSAGLGNLQWGMMGLLIFAWCLLLYLTTASDTYQLAFAADAFHIKSSASATTKKMAAASIAPMLCSPKHPIHQILSHIPSVIPAVNAGQHAGIALSQFLRSHSSA